MADNPGTLDRILAEIGQALLPLRDALTSADAFTGLARTLGWTVAAVPQPVLDVGSAADTLFDSLGRLLGDGGINLGGSLGSPNDGTFAPDEAVRTLTALQKLIAAIRAIATAPASAFRRRWSPTASPPRSPASCSTTWSSPTCSGSTRAPGSRCARWVWSSPSTPRRPGTGPSTSTSAWT
jgi:hypothetical protein